MHVLRGGWFVARTHAEKIALARTKAMFEKGMSPSEYEWIRERLYGPKVGGEDAFPDLMERIRELSMPGLDDVADECLLSRSSSFDWD